MSQRLIGLTVLLLLVITPLGWPAAYAGASAATPGLSVTSHTIIAGGRTLAYTATAGTLPLRDGQGRVEASMFFVAYTERGAPDGTARPVTFAFNGGPGAASVLLDLGALGPKRVSFDANGLVASEPAAEPSEGIRATGSPASQRTGAPAALTDNDQTWLPFTDLVLVDAIGTGLSRAAPGVPAGRFYQVRGDAEAFAQFIHLYLRRFHRERSPVFLAGESYGGTRAAILARLLPRRYGVSPRGLILISPALDFGVLNAEFENPYRSTDLAYAMDVPTYAAVAWYHGRLAPEWTGNLTGLLGQVERWATDTYLPALVQGDALPEDARAAVARTLSAYTGISEAFILAHHLRVLPGAFRHELLAAQRLEVGADDGRVTFPPGAARQYGTGALLSALASVFTGYLRDDLRYRTATPYVGLSSAVVHQWNWGFGGLTGALNVTGDLRWALEHNPSLRVLVVQGRYDLVVPYSGTTYALRHLGVGPSLRSNVVQRIYEDGHMVYTTPAALRALAADARALIAGTAIP
jgi:carboxypeptidase C (cathepsin A)